MEGHIPADAAVPGAGFTLYRAKAFAASRTFTAASIIQQRARQLAQDVDSVLTETTRLTDPADRGQCEALESALSELRDDLTCCAARLDAVLATPGQ